MARSFRIQWAQVAIRDLEDIFEYIARHDSVSAARRLCSRIRKQARKLSRLPARCRVVPELRDLGVAEYRELVVPPYRLFFRIRARVVGIVGVLDGRRDLEELLISRVLREP